MNGDHSIPADFRGIIEECAYRSLDEDIEGIPEWERFRVVSDEIGIFLYILARSSSRNRIVEMGGRGGAGSSIIWLAGAAEQVGGQVLAWEANPRRWVKLQNSLSQARLSPNVEIRTSDPLWRTGDGGGVIAPPSVDEATQDKKIWESSDACDMVVVTLTEPDWPQRIAHGWDLLVPGGLLVLTDTLQADESANEILGQFFEANPAAVVGFRLGEGILLASRLASPNKPPDQPQNLYIPNAELVGEKAASILEELNAENRKPGSRLWAIPPETGRFLWIITRAMGAKNVLEIGSSGGYSGTWIASALKSSGGKLTTMDLDPEKVARARESYQRAGVDDRVEILEGDALEILPTLERTYDLIFLDCSKEFYLDLVEPILWRLRRGGLLIADNVISHREELVGYLDMVKQHSCLASVTVPVGSGEEVTMVL